MSLPIELISQFVKATKDETKQNNETTVYGTTVMHNGTIYVQLDGSNPEIFTPVSSTADTKPGERVTVLIKDHTATITGNMSSPAARTGDLEDTNNKITEVGTLVADKASIKDLEVERARIDAIIANTGDFGSLKAMEADIEFLKAGNLEVSEKVTAAEADIDNLKTNKLDASVADITYATIENLESTDADIHNLEVTYGEFVKLNAEQIEAIQADIVEINTKKLSATDIEGKYANIDFSNISEATMQWFYANSGLIENVTVSNGTITGNLVGVTIKGDLIEGNTVKAEKLVIKGTDGLYYKLNTDGVTTEAEQTDQNSLDGSVIMAKSITATKISVDDLVAFDATIGGFKITDNSLYSGVKSTVGNTTRGTYLDSDGQMAVGDGSNFIKYYKDADGKYKLAISASSIIFASSNKSMETAIEESVNDAIDSLEIGGRNLIKNSDFTNGTSKWATVGLTATVESDETYDSFLKIVSSSIGSIDSRLYPSTTDNFFHSPNTYALSFYAKADSDTTMQTNVAGSDTCAKNYSLTTKWQKFTNVYYASAGSLTFWPNEANTTVYLTKVKMEIGDKHTDWTPAVEDMATSDDVDRLQNTVDKVEEDAAEAHALIAQLSDSISMLVTDGNGTSLMTQTADGWTFSTSEIQSAIASAAESLSALESAVGDTDNTVEVLRQAVEDLGTIAEYVKIRTYESEPCIELGESDSDFKLLITNTRILFMEGSSIVAYINNQSLYIKKAVIEEELQQGKFVWKARSNGNLGLIWKGA